MICQLCKGEGALIRVVEYWPVFATEEKPSRTHDDRIICFQCYGTGEYPINVEKLNGQL